jgi:hypothetical protein
MHKPFIRFFDSLKECKVSAVDLDKVFLNAADCLLFQYSRVKLDERLDVFSF